MNFAPPKRVFQIAPQNSVARHEVGTYDLPPMIGASRSSNGGMLTYFSGHPYPRKSFIYPEAVIAINKVKRVTLSLFLPFSSIKKGIKGFIESYLENYIRLIDSLLSDYERVPYLHYQYYCEFSKASWNFTFIFLRYLGFSFNIAYKIGLIIATIFEYDDAYRVRPQDLLSETTLKALTENPRKEINRLLEILKERDPTFSKDGLGAGDRIRKLSKMFSFLLYIPKVKKAFIRALQECNFKWFQYDEIDKYWALCRADYHTFGRTFDERKEENIQMMISFMEKNNPGMKVKRIPKEDGSEDLVTYNPNDI